MTPDQTAAVNRAREAVRPHGGTATPVLDKFPAGPAANTVIEIKIPGAPFGTAAPHRTFLVIAPDGTLTRNPLDLIEEAAEAGNPAVHALVDAASAVNEWTPDEVDAARATVALAWQEPKEPELLGAYTLLAEERFAFTVTRPSAFVNVHLGTGL